jgi:hypothetical protein
VKALAGASSSAELERILRQLPIRWYLAHPGAALAWPSEVLATPAFEAAGFRVYDLAPFAAPQKGERGGE